MQYAPTQNFWVGEASRGASPFFALFLPELLTLRIAPI